MKKEFGQMKFTGERYVPEMHGNIELEHLHRYLLVCKAVEGKAVLDIASGEGYGSAMLARTARKVIGVDISQEAILHARAKYRSENLDFRLGSCSAIPLEDESVDVVVSFETIEHHDEHQAMMREIKRVLQPGGVLVISSPDKLEYSDKSGYTNPHHVKELYRDEFNKLLGSHFKNHRISGQQVVYGSAIFCEDSPSPLNSYTLADGTLSAIKGVPHAVYLVAIASDGELPPTESGLLTQPIEESDVVRGQIASFSQAVAERDSQIASLNQVVAARDRQLAEWDGQIATLKRSVFDLNYQLTAIMRSNSWQMTRPFREIRRCIDTPKVKFEQYVKAGLSRLRRLYQALPLSLQVKIQHRNWIARYAPCLLSAGSSHPTTATLAISTSPPNQSGLFPVGSQAAVRSELVEEIALPVSTPIVSVIIPVCGKIGHTVRCLKSIESNPPNLRFEIVLVGDSSLDHSDLPRLQASDVRLVINTETSEFIQCCNMGAKVARGKYLMFLDNDNEVMPGWMDKVLRASDKCTGKERVKIAAVTMIYNEALILPYFLRHYRYLDVIHVLYETDTTDDSLELLMRAPNVVIEKGHIEGGLDDIEKISLINRAVQRTKADWVYVVDADEFIFPPNNESPYDFLKRQSSDVVRSGMYQVYRHRNDSDLDPFSAPVPQRTHGDPDLFSTDQQNNRASNSLYVKPNIVRPSKGIRFLPGHHQIEGDPEVSSELYVGAHWQMADPSFALSRRMERKARISERNRAHQMGWQHFDVSVDKIKEECLLHQDYPEIDALRTFSEVPVQDLFSAG